MFNIIVLDLILSGDNAVVIGMAARNLPDPQRKKAIVLGAGAAVLLRASLTAIAAWLLNIPLIMSIGSVLLLWIAVKLLVEDGDDTHVEGGKDLKSAIKTIIIADVVMSLDNVLAVAGASHGNLILVLFGLTFSIPIIMWGSRLIAALLNKLNWLVYVGAAILGYVAGDMMVQDPMLKGLFADQPILSEIIPGFLALMVIVVGFLKKKLQGNQNAI
jgi:YjbE family integral membrane protein